MIVYYIILHFVYAILIDYQNAVYYSCIIIDERVQITTLYRDKILEALTYCV